MTKDDLDMIRCSQVITDPFQALTNKMLSGPVNNQFEEAVKFLEANGFPNPWAAYKKGYDKAYEEIEAKCIEG